VKRLVACLVLTVWPAFAAEEPKSEAGTQFMERCLADITEHRIATLKRQAPEYAAGLSDDELQAGGQFLAQKTCPCFLQVIAVDARDAGTTPEEKVAGFVAFLHSLGTDDVAPLPASLPKLTRLCGVRSSVMPSRWIER